MATSGWEGLKLSEWVGRRNDPGGASVRGTKAQGLTGKTLHSFLPLLHAFAAEYLLIIGYFVLKFP